VKHILTAIDDPLDFAGVAEIAFMEFDGIAQVCQIGQRPGTQIVEDAHLMSLLDEAGDNVRTNEAGTTGDEITSHTNLRVRIETPDRKA
jgi:hypothetical protein